MTYIGIRLCLETMLIFLVRYGVKFMVNCLFLNLHPSLTCIPDPPRKKQKKEEVKVHSSGSARTEGYYHLTDNDKMKYMQNSKLMVAEQLGVDANDDSNVEVKKNIQLL